MLTDKIYQLIIAGLGAVLIILSLKLWFISNELSDTKLNLKVEVAEHEVTKVSNAGLVYGINKQTEALSKLKEDQDKDSIEKEKAITKVEYRYTEKIKWVNDMNSSTECDTLKRIIDDEVSSNNGDSTI